MDSSHSAAADVEAAARRLIEAGVHDEDLVIAVTQLEADRTNGEPLDDAIEALVRAWRRRQHPGRDGPGAAGEVRR